MPEVGHIYITPDLLFIGQGFSQQTGAEDQRRYCEHYYVDNTLERMELEIQIGACEYNLPDYISRS